VEESRGIWQRKNPSTERRNTKKDLVIFSIFLLISFIFWYINSLKKEFTADIRYPVEFINIPAGKSVPGDAPGRVTLNLAGKGFAILRLKITGSSEPLKIDFAKAEPVSNASDSRGSYCLSTGMLAGDFSRQLDREFRITSVLPDTLFLNLEPGR
jgi:hypothetical protein